VLIFGEVLRNGFGGHSGYLGPAFVIVVDRGAIEVALVVEGKCAAFHIRGQVGDIPARAGQMHHNLLLVPFRVRDAQRRFPYARVRVGEQAVEIIRVKFGGPVTVRIAGFQRLVMV